ncbi:MAG: helix-turn-helix domain-containing protein [Candidatus Micrarchaeia archaeon]
MGDQAEVLALAGLTEVEARVAGALLELGPCGAGALIKRTGLHRELVYSALDRLIHRGLVAFILRNNVKEFWADRARLAKLLQGRIEEIQAFIPSLVMPAARGPGVRVFEGEKGLRMLAAELEAEEEILFLGFPPPAEKLAQLLPARKKVLAEGKPGLKGARFLPKTIVVGVPLAVCGNKTMLFTAGEAFLAVLINDAGLAASRRSLFQALWRNAKE